MMTIKNSKNKMKIYNMKLKDWSKNKNTLNIKPKFKFNLKKIKFNLI